MGGSASTNKRKGANAQPKASSLSSSLLPPTRLLHPPGSLGSQSEMIKSKSRSGVAPNARAADHWAEVIKLLSAGRMRREAATGSRTRCRTASGSDSSCGFGSRRRVKKALFKETKNELQQSGAELTECRPVELLEASTTLAVNVFLKACRKTPEELAALVRRGDAGSLGADRLSVLSRLLPRAQEVAALTASAEDSSALEPPERLFLLLTHIPAYDLRVNAMLLHEELPSELKKIEKQLQAVITECQSVKGDKDLRIFLHLALLLENRLNEGHNIPNTTCFKLMDLPKFSQLKAHSDLSKFTFLQYVTKVATHIHEEEALSFVDRLKGVLQLPQISLKNIRQTLKEQMADISCICEYLESSLQDMKVEYGEFFTNSSQQIISLLQLLEIAENTWMLLAKYFCEDAQQLPFEEGIAVLSTFLVDVRKAQKDLGHYQAT